MESIYFNVRKTVLRSILLLTIAATVLDLLFFVGYLAMGLLPEEPFLYILFRVAPPLVLNLISYQVARYSNGIEKLSEENKNYAVSFALCTFFGVIGIFHSQFVPFWTSASIATLFCTIYGDTRLIRLLSVYNCILSGLACLSACLRMPENICTYGQNLIVVLCLNVVAHVIGESMLHFSVEMRALQDDLYKESVDYKEQLDVDFLTGVSSRAHMTKEAQKILYRASQFNPVSIAIIDIDNFKSINDTYGHENGDVVLKALGNLLKTQLKDDVVVGRYGGEEFVIVFEGVSTGIHGIRLNRVRQLFSEIHYDFTDRPITFSGGIKSVIDPAEFMPTLQKADEALYVSKNSGKNKVTVAGAPAE